MRKTDHHNCKTKLPSSDLVAWSASPPCAMDTSGASSGTFSGHSGHVPRVKNSGQFFGGSGQGQLGIQMVVHPSESSSPEGT